ncbi:MAG: hypothetical protein JRI23_00430 [Deltaproteobacteria bacterium]|nr:hypothetical protein [Deltaproteobacteria bacterium]MBW2529911.1 hypothetical protein [Deltaproteobacteria bacterium]
MTSRFALSGDLGVVPVALACALALVAVALLLWELGRRKPPPRPAQRLAVAGSGVLGAACLLLAVLRPVQIETRGRTLGARVVVLVDGSRSIDLPADGDGTRRDVVGSVLQALGQRLVGVRVRGLTFGKGAPQPLPALGAGAESSPAFDAPPQLGSDLTAALEAVARQSDEEPSALVVVSDGRLDRPSAERAEPELRDALGRLDVPIHTVAVARTARPDAAVRAVRMAGAAVAHQPASITVEVACVGGLACQELPVVAWELRPDGPPIRRASSTARLAQGTATVELPVTLDQAGRRIVEIEIEAPAGDQIQENDRRLLPVDVTRDRVRLLHLAGRPTYDVRALRLWLESDASLDVVAFFILRTPQVDKPGAPVHELALIPFPVDELFTTHLSSFDAVILQDFDAVRHELLRHMRSVAEYVRSGGGLIVVGGETSFVSGRYDRGPLGDVLPVRLDGIDAKEAIDFASFVPDTTAAGRAAPVLEPLRALMSSELPEMQGVNVVGDARPDATVLWSHPWLRTRGGAPMPVLALGEYGNGRSIALGVDGSHRLRFSSFAAGVAGRAHGAFWDGLLGWLMRDPRFEPAVVELPEPCIAGRPVALRLRSVFWRGVHERGGRAALEITRMGRGQVAREHEVLLGAGDDATKVELDPLEPGGYAVTVRLVEPGRAAPSRYEFACEAGGPEWADPRPDPDRLEAIARSTGGVALDAAEVASLPVPESAQIVSERRVLPIAPPWGWSLLAALSLGGHWLVRRFAGLS